MALQLHEKTGSKFVITLKEITDILQVRHNDAMRKAEQLALEPSFGTLRKTRSVYNDKGQTMLTERILKFFKGEGDE